MFQGELSKTTAVGSGRGPSHVGGPRLPSHPQHPTATRKHSLGRLPWLPAGACKAVQVGEWCSMQGGWRGAGSSYNVCDGKKGTDGIIVQALHLLCASPLCSEVHIFPGRPMQAPQHST